MGMIAIPAAFALAGAGLGSLVGIAGIGAAIGWSIGSYIASRIYKPELEPQTIEMGKMTREVSLMDSSYGRPIPIIYGTFRVGGNIIWAADIQEHVTEEEQEVQVGRGKAAQTYVQTTRHYWYTCSFAVALCKGPIYGIRRIWADGKLIYNVSATATDDELAQSEKLAEQMDIYLGTEDQQPNPLMESYLGTGNVPAYRGLAYVVFHDFLLSDYGNRIPNFSFEVVTNGHALGTSQIVPDPIPISSIIDDICEKAGLESEYVDTSTLDDEVQGFLVTETSARDALEVLCSAFILDGVESDGKVKFVKRGSDPVVTLNEDDLGACAEGQESQVLSITRRYELALPQKVEVRYIDVDRDFQENAQRTLRYATSSKNSVIVDLPLAMTATQARRVSEVLMYNMWMSRTIYEFTTTYKHLALDPGDVIEVIHDGDSHRMRIVSIDIGYPGLIRIRAMAEDAAIYDAISEGYGGEYQPPQISPVAVPDTELFLIDVATINDNESGPGFYVAGGGGEKWRGGALYRSIDGGTTYSYFSPIVQGVVGYTLNALPPGITTTWDEANYVDVQLICGSLQSVSELAVLNWANLAVIGDELVQFQDAELIGENTYRLRRLLRGRKGTEWAVGNHSVGDRFVLISRTVFREMEVSEIGLARWYKAVSFGQLIDDAEEHIWTYFATNLRPLSPVHIWAERDEYDNIYINWTRRTRVGGEWRDEVDVPLGEEREEYEVDILDADDNVVRTLWGITETWVEYSAEQQIEDFGSVQSQVKVRVYQISALVGRGFAGEATV